MHLNKAMALLLCFLFCFFSVERQHKQMSSLEEEVAFVPRCDWNDPGCWEQSGNVGHGYMMWRGAICKTRVNLLSR